MAYSLSCSAIFGVNVGAEILTKETVQAMDKDANWGFLIDLFAIRIMFIHFVE